MIRTSEWNVVLDAIAQISAYYARLSVSCGQLTSR
jgi:hypothetical protein